MTCGKNYLSPKRGLVYVLAAWDPSDLTISWHCVLNHTWLHLILTTATLYWLGRPSTVTDKLHRVLNVAACVFTGTWKSDRGLSHRLHSKLHWLNLPQHVQYKVRVAMCRCLQHSTSRILCVHLMFPVVSVCCQSVVTVWSYHDVVATSLVIEHYKLQIWWPGLRTWNSLSNYFWDRTLSFNSDRHRKLVFFVMLQDVYRVSQKKSPLWFSEIFSETVGNLRSIFYTPIMWSFLH